MCFEFQRNSNKENFWNMYNPFVTLEIVYNNCSLGRRIFKSGFEDRMEVGAGRKERFSPEAVF